MGLFGLLKRRIKSRYVMEVKCKEDIRIPGDDINGKVFEQDEMHCVIVSDGSVWIEGIEAFKDFKNNKRFHKYFEVVK